MMQQQFALRAKEILQEEPSVIGLAAAGSWLTNEMDEYADLDLVLVTKEKISGHKEQMVQYAQKLGTLLSAFTGEHVGEPRLLICLYDAPLLHVDIKFVTLQEFGVRVETPFILLDKDSRLQEMLTQTQANFPYPDHQWIEDRFWTWIHYALLKTRRGEYLEAFDFSAFLRMVVLGPLIHIKNGNQPRGVRKVETQIDQQDLSALLSTVPAYNKDSLLHSLQQCVVLYRSLREELFNDGVVQNKLAEEKVMNYFKYISET